MDEKLDKRFGEYDKKLDKRFAEYDEKLDKRFTEYDRKMDARFAQQDAKWEKIFKENFEFLVTKLSDVLDQKIALVFENMESSIEVQMRHLFQENNQVLDAMMEDKLSKNNAIAASIFVTKGECEVLRKTL